MRVTNFESIAALVEHFNKVNGKKHCHGWYTGQTPETTIERALNGDMTLVSESEKMMDSIEASISDSVSPVWHNSVCGSVLSVPDYLIGLPTPFRRLQHVENESSPVRIFVNVVCSGGINNELMRIRGCAIMALCMRLQQVRSVDVVLVSELYESNGHGIDANTYDTVTLESRPLSLAHTANALADDLFARHICYAIGHSRGWSGSWPHEGTPHQESERYKKQRIEALGLTETDIYVPGAFIHDEVITNPVQWINTHLDRLGYGALQE